VSGFSRTVIIGSVGFMTDDDFLPGWACVCDEGCELAQEMLTNNSIDSAVVRLGTHSKYSKPTLWVRDADYDRSVALIDKMLHALDNPPIAPWLCRCGEQIEATFDSCWNCGKDKP
jgi:hypothetical protein